MTTAALSVYAVPTIDLAVVGRVVRMVAFAGQSVAAAAAMWLLLAGPGFLSAGG